MQMPARTPAMTAMTAATIDLLTGGRFMLASELQDHKSSKLARSRLRKLLTRTREYVEIVRTILKREQASSITASTTTYR